MAGTERLYSLGKARGQGLIRQRCRHSPAGLGHFKSEQHARVVVRVRRLHSVAADAFDVDRGVGAPVRRGAGVVSW